MKNELVLLCLSLAFSTTQFNISHTVDWLKNYDLFKQEKVENRITMNYPRGFDEEKLKEYLSPYEHTWKTIEDGKKTISGPLSVYCKLLLPRYYKKKKENIFQRRIVQKNFEKASSTFRSLANCKENELSYTFKGNISTIRVLNDSINKFPLRPDPYKDYSLICEDIFMGGDRNYAKTTALVETDCKFILNMIANRHVELEKHPSNEFYQAVSINGVKSHFPFLLTRETLEVIKEMRKYSLNLGNVLYNRRKTDISQ